MRRPCAQRSVFTLGMQSGNLMKVNKQVDFQHLFVLVTCPAKYFTTALEVRGPTAAKRGPND